MMTLDEIKDKARRQGACQAIEGVQSYGALVDLMFSPIGREFCVNTGFPDLDTLRAIAPQCGERMIVDAGSIELAPRGDIAIGGDTDATIYYSDLDRLYHLVLLRGSRAHIVLRDYAVLTITAVEGSSYSIDCAPTAYISIEQKQTR